MTNITLYHNPRCSKSRQALVLLEAQTGTVTVHRYLEAPLDYTALSALLQRLEGELRDLVRVGESAWKSLGLNFEDEAAVLAALAREPNLMQRPIADDGKRAIVGRPPQAVLALLDSD
ncbi:MULTISPECIES: arsenate reductase family protein [Halomonadaceae]|uniref:arsenate reductase family protein n=1 Tax=Halomonadaceae TaxID=28256 RepID=UPI001599DC47|nr:MULTISPECIES: arsenate reductase family protein [Halomonas]QJQ96628.1 arsenate reductase family protein [Halomonas sp. PA5]